MPVYELECTACHEQFEEIAKSKDDLADSYCPKCGGQKFQMCFTSFGHYSIKGNNSASVTPKKYRGGK